MEAPAEGGYPRPRLVVSRCLDFEPVRYDGERIPCAFVRRLAPWVDFLPVCPELAIGLGVPRDPVRLVWGRGEAGGARRAPGTAGSGGAPGLRMIQPSTGLDLTERMEGWAERFLEGLEGAGGSDGIDGFLLKARSPSCGTMDVKRYGAVEDEEPEGRTAGLFATAVLERFPGATIENEERLEDPRLRERFLVRLFARAARREAGPGGESGGGTVPFGRGDPAPRGEAGKAATPAAGPRAARALVPPGLLEAEPRG